MPFQIIEGDITQMETDAVVNAANTHLKMGGGVCGAIFHAADPVKLQKACDVIGFCNTGEAVITPGFRLGAKYVIHAVGPVWQGGNQNEEAQLKSAYWNSMQLAMEHECRSIAFPLISSGIYGYPKEGALCAAVSVIGDYVLNHDLDVVLVVFDRAVVKLDESIRLQVEQYIISNYKEVTDYEKQKLSNSYFILKEENILNDFSSNDLKELLNQEEETFSEMLLRLIAEKNMSEVETYKRANMDRKLFSKIKNNRDYQPKKKTVLSFAIALKLKVDEMEKLLESAGYTLTNNSKMDVIVRYFIEKGEYNIFVINEVLFYYEQPLLGN